MLIDKGFYDYDYEAVSEKAVRHEQSEERTNNMMKRFGFGKKDEHHQMIPFGKNEGQTSMIPFGKNDEHNPMSPEEIQREVMSDSDKPKE